MNQKQAIIKKILGILALGTVLLVQAQLLQQSLTNQVPWKNKERADRTEQTKESEENGNEKRRDASVDVMPLEEGMISVEQQEPTTIHSQTEYILEVYDREHDRFSEYTLPPPGVLIGLDRDGVENYVKQYLEHLPLDEFQMGLLSYECRSFSPEKIVLRKVYDQSTVPFQYYLVVEHGTLVVYYADRRTVYEYTGIDVGSLSEEVQRKLAYGVFVKDQNELYDLLQDYSS